MHAPGIFFLLPLLIATASVRDATAGNVSRNPIIETIEVSGQTDARYHLFLPESYTGDGTAAILYLFDPGGNGAAILGHFKPAAQKFGWILIGCDKLRNRMNAESGFAAQMTREIMNDAESRVSFDPERRYLGGFSGGAARAYGIVRTFRRPIRGVIAVGGWLGNYDENNIYPEGLTVVTIHGTADRGASKYHPGDVAILEKHGVIVKSFFFEGGHTMPGPDEIERAVAWLHEMGHDKEDLPAQN